MGRKIGTVLSFLTLFIEIFSALFLTPLIIRSFGQAEYGVYTLVLSITSYLTLLDLGVGSSVVRFMAQYRANNQREEERKFLGITSLYNLGVAIVTIAVGVILVFVLPFAFAKGLNESEIILAQKLLMISCVNIAVVMGTSNYYNAIVSYENFFISKGLTIFVTILRIIISIIALNLGAKSIEIIIINTLTNIVLRLIMVMYVIFKMKILPTLKNVDFKMIKTIISFSLIILLHLLGTQINNIMGQVLIGALATSSATIIAVYGVGSQINHYFQTLGGALNGVIMPGIVRLVETQNTTKVLQNELTRIGRMNFAFVGFIWTAFLIFGKQFVVLWSGEVNSNAYYVALLLTFSMTFVLTLGVATNMLIAMNKHKLLASLKIIVVLVNLVLTVFLIKWNALFGAAIGTFISLLLGDVVAIFVVLKKEVKISIKSYLSDLFNGIIPSLIISGIAGYLFRFLALDGWIGFIINGAMMTCCYIICMLLFGFNNYEKSLIKNIIKRGR